MWKPQVALRNFLGDPWPRMVMHAGGGVAEDRMTLIEAINEATRLGSGFAHTRNREAHREILEQTLISATTSAEALTAILSRAQRDAGNFQDQPQLQRERRRVHNSPRRRRRLEWLDLVTPARKQEEEERSILADIDVAGLTGIERRLLARYRQAVADEACDSMLGNSASSFPRPSSMPSPSILAAAAAAAGAGPPAKGPASASSDVLSTPLDSAAAGGAVTPAVVLECGSYAVPYAPSESSAPTSAATSSPPPSSPSSGSGLQHEFATVTLAGAAAATAAAGTAPAGAGAGGPAGWNRAKSKAVAAAGGLKHVIKDADDSVQGTPLHARPPQPLTHASLFATFKQFREHVPHTRLDDDDLPFF